MVMEWFKYYTAESGEVVFDLGAGGNRKRKGESMLYYSNSVGNNGIVYAVEPVIENYLWLIEKIHQYQLTNVVPLMVAMGQHSGRQEININKRPAGHSIQIYRKKLMFSKRPVLVVSWDDLIDILQIEYVDLAKANIEGAEKEWVLGMTKALPQRMGIKFHIKWRSFNIAEMKGLLEEKGYRVQRVKQRRDTSFLAELIK